MKIRPVMTLAALLTALFLFSACGADAPFEAKEIAYEPVQSVQSNGQQNWTLPFGEVGKEPRTLVYQYNETTLSGEAWEVFRADDGTTAKICKQNASISVTAGLGSTIADAPKQLKTEADFLACVQDWVHRLAPDADLSAYTYACTTAYLVRADGEQDYYGESKVADRFYRPQNENEEIEGYLFTYTQMANGSGNELATENGVTVETDGKGNLLAIRYDCYDTDWAFAITNKELEDTVDAFIDAHEKEAFHRTIDVEILQKHLAIVEGEVQLSVTVSAVCTPRDSSIEVAYMESFSLYLSPKKAS